jgi:hypothetical protein
MLGTLIKTCRENPDLVTIAQKYWALYVKILVRLYVAGYKNSQKKHCFLLMVMTCNSAKYRECIVAFSLQPQVQKLANMLRCTCFVCLVTAFVRLTKSETKLQIVTTPLPADDGPARFETCRNVIV